MNHIDSEEIIKQYPALFDGSIGALKDYKVKLHIDTSVQPVPPPNPVQCAKKVEDKLVELENADIIEKVDGPTPWISPIVTPPKPDEIRLCVDMRGPNTVIKRERHITPTIEDGISDLNGACVFSKLDLNQGYHQIMLDESSRYITSFSTHVGLRRYKRLNFGICCASEIFQNVVPESLDGLPGVMNVSDDILIYGCNHTEHDKRLHAALQRLQEKGLTLNRQTCIFGQPTLKYLGYVFSSKEKRSLMGDFPYPLGSFLCQITKRFSDGSEFRDESLAVICQTEQWSYLTRVSRCCRFMSRCNFTWIGRYSLAGENVAQIFQSRLTEDTRLSV